MKSSVVILFAEKKKRRAFALQKVSVLGYNMHCKSSFHILGKKGIVQHKGQCFFGKKRQCFGVQYVLKFNVLLAHVIVSFEQPGPDIQII